MEHKYDYIRRLFSIELPGKEAHHEMAPEGRSLQYEHLRENARLSAVLLLLFEQNHILHGTLIQRNEYKGHHSGQIALPGGRREIEDTDLKETALRETEEEIGIDRKHVELAGRLSELFIPVSNFIVEPYVGLYINDKPKFIAEPKEVAQVIEFPVSELLSGNNVFAGYKGIKSGQTDKKIFAPYFTLQNHTVWGATAMLLNEFKQLILKEEHLKS